MKLLQSLGIAVVVVLASMGFANAQSWTPLTNQPGVTLGPMLQLRDGRVLAHEEQAGNPAAWHILTPDATGSYVNGTWGPGGLLPPGYGPVYFGSQVLLDGRQVVVEGGEYNFGVAVWTTLGAIGTVTPFSGPLSWAPNLPPAGWGTIGDAESIILANGRYMQSNCCTAENALFNGPNSWTPTGSVKQPNNDESGFTLLTNGKVLTVDAKFDSACGTGQGSELYDQGTSVWSCGPNTPVQLYNAGDEELGAAVLMYNNRVWQMGGNVVASAVYDVASNTWSAGPTPSGRLDQADGPSALEPNGKVLAMLSPGLFQSGCQFVEYNPTTNTLANVPNPANCPGDSSFYGHLMILPTGQIMFTDFSGFVEVYTPAPGVVAGVAPTVLLPSTILNSGSTNNLLYGLQLNGLSQNNAYGDDYQGETDYPLVRLTSVADGSVHYAFTHDDSTHSIARNTFGHTKFDLPTLTPGMYDFVTVTNGIASNPIHVRVQ
jgi:hypothetical protein